MFFTDKPFHVKQTVFILSYDFMFHVKQSASPNFPTSSFSRIR